MKKNILITGAAGLIGSNLSHWLIENTEHDVVGIDDLSGGYLENMPQHKRFDFIEADVKDYKKLLSIYQLVKPEITIHLQSYAAEGLSPFIRCYNYQTNTVATAAVVNCCIKLKSKLVFTSSNAVYSGLPPFDESTVPNPIDSYGISKLCSELDIKVAAAQHGLEYVIIRPRNVYGERQSIFDPVRNVLGIWMYQYLNNQPMTIFGDGSHRRAFTYIGDILEPLYIAAMEVTNDTINLGSAKSYSILEANNILRGVIGGGEVVHLEDRHEVAEAFCRTNKSIELLDYDDKTSLEVGLTKMWRWVKEQPMRERRKPPEYEITNGLYETWKK